MVDYNTKIPIIPSRYEPDTIYHSPVTKLDSRLNTAGMTTGGGGDCGNDDWGDYGNDDGGVRE